MVVQIAHRGCGVFTLGDIQHPTGHSPKQPVAGNSALSREGWLKQSGVVLSNLGAYGKTKCVCKNPTADLMIESL